MSTRAAAHIASPPTPRCTAQSRNWYVPSSGKTDLRSSLDLTVYLHDVTRHDERTTNPHLFLSWALSRRLVPPNADHPSPMLVRLDWKARKSQKKDFTPSLPAPTVQTSHETSQRIVRPTHVSLHAAFSGLSRHFSDMKFGHFDNWALFAKRSSTNFNGKLSKRPRKP